MSKLLKAMFCVTFFSVATRALGFVLKIYLSRNMSSELLGSYQVTMSIFGVLMTLVSSGIPVVLSRNVAYYYGKKDKKSIGSIVSSGLILTATICLIVSLFIILFPNILKLIFTSNESLQMLYVLLPALLFSSVYEVLRGALWGEKQFFAISFTEFIEQISRIIIIVLLFELPITNFSPTTKTAMSLSIACIISSIFVCILYKKYDGNLASPKLEFKKLVKTSTPITAVRTVSSVVTSIISVIIPIKLMDYGLSQSEALSEFGIIMGMTFPLIMIPGTLIGSLAVTMIPSISEQSNNIDSGELKDKSILKSKINLAIKLSVLFSCILMPIFITLGKPICEIIFANTKAGTYLEFSAICMIPLGLSQISSSILNAIGLEMKSLKNYVISAVMLILSIWFLPRYFGTYALVIGYILMSTISSTLNLLMLKKRELLSNEFLKTILELVFIISFSCISGNILIKTLHFSKIIKIIICSMATELIMLAQIFLLNIADIKIITRNRLFKRHKMFSREILKSSK